MPVIIKLNIISSKLKLMCFVDNVTNKRVILGKKQKAAAVL